MTRTNGSAQPKMLWAYAYEVTRAQGQEEDALHDIGTLLDREHMAAHARARVWSGRLVIGRRTNKILVVSDNPKQNRDVNRRLEALLRTLKMEFSMSVPMAVEADPTEPPPPKAAS